MDMKLPFSTTGMMLHIDDSMDYEVLSSSIESMPKSDKTEDEIVLEAMAHPIGSPKLSELAKVMTRYPQVMINLNVSAEGKLLFYTDKEIKAVVESAKKALGKEGRIVVRPSGTEPLIRVMAEGSDEALIREQAQAVANVIQNRLGGKQ